MRRAAGAQWEGSSGRWWGVYSLDAATWAGWPWANPFTMGLGLVVWQ